MSEPAIFRGALAIIVSASAILLAQQHTARTAALIGPHPLLKGGHRNDQGRRESVESGIC
jgi:hypothetical protein